MGKKMSELGIKLRKLFRLNREDNSENNLESQNLLSSETSIQINEDQAVKPPPTKERMVALDIMRGMTIMLMIIVNNQPSTAFYLLDHAEWFGMTPTYVCSSHFLLYMSIFEVIVFFHSFCL